MCAEEVIPAINRIDRIRQTLEDIEEDVGERLNIFALERTYGTNNEVVECENYITNHLDVDSLRESLTNRGRTRIMFELANDYENIFSVYGLSRRSARQRPLSYAEPADVEVKDMMFEWIVQCLDNSNPSMDLDPPDETVSFPSILENNLPLQLDLNNWISGYLLNCVAVRLSGERGRSPEVEVWQSWFGSGGQRPIPHSDDGYHDVIPFFGIAAPGRLVWRPMQVWPLAQNA